MSNVYCQQLIFLTKQQQKYLLPLLNTAKSRIYINILRLNKKKDYKYLPKTTPLKRDHFLGNLENKIKTKVKDF